MSASKRLHTLTVDMTRLKHEIRQPYIRLTIIWILAMVSVPIIRWTIGDSAIPTMATLTTLLQFSAVAAILVYSWGIRRTLTVFGGVAVLTYFAEFIGSKTGFPFGVYHYTEVLQPQLFDVPVLIPLAWFMMLPPAWSVAAAISGHRVDTIQHKALFVLLSATAMTAWDLFLDPQMVGWGFWVWESPSGYFGIPWVNYAGWLLTAGLVTAVIRPADLPRRPLILIYGIVWALQSIGLAIFWGQPGPALGGFLAMGSFLLLALRSIQVKTQ